MIFLFSLGSILGIVNATGTIASVRFLLLTITEIFILKVLYIYKFSTIAVINEYFIKNILIGFNIIFIGINVIILGLLKEYEIDPAFSPHKNRESLLMFIDANYVNRNARK